MLDQIDNVFSHNENIILMGDLNYDYKLDESLSSNPLHQRHATTNQFPYPSYIDHVYTY